MRKCTPFAVQKSELEQRGAGQDVALCQHLQLAQIVAVGHDDGGSGGMACGADGVQIHLQQRGAGLDLVTLLDQSLEALAVHLHGVHADVHQDLDAVFAGQTDSVQGGSHLVLSAVNGGIHGLAGGLDAAAGAQDALCGEAVVFPHGAPAHFMTMVKQQGALLAKGRLLGIQFDVLFTDDLYTKISKNAIDTANALKKGLAAKGYRFFMDSTTNQVFVILDNAQLAALEGRAKFGFWEKFDDTHTVVRIATSWATRMEEIEQLIALM